MFTEECLKNLEYFIIYRNKLKWLILLSFYCVSYKLIIRLNLKEKLVIISSHVFHEFDFWPFMVIKGLI